ncbi:hypothetical protein POTOM_012425 [Populus tomentosa]|uniref:Uncharacterized protein n=1 Tax=Populus tomentosa TaxID=118781 RepID=A0A8X8A4X7_POPTO|nr:hypothetical protein POTOM_012425 [Populus tomentosa]
MASTAPLHHHLTHCFSISQPCLCERNSVEIRRFYYIMDGQQDHHPDIHSSETGKTALILPLVPADPLKLFQLIYLRILSFNLLKSKKSLTLRFYDKLEPADPDFYRIGYARSMRAYGIEFKEGPDGFGVYAAKDVEPLRRARVVMEIPIELMLNISKKLPWMFFPDIIPLGHPIFDIINSTDPETDWDLRLACLLLFAFDCKDNFWQLYSDFLPSADECPSLLLATEEDLLELQDENLASTMRKQQLRALEFWEKNWHSGAPLKIKRLARDPEKFIWAVSMAQSRCINMQIRVGALTQDTNMLIPYAGSSCKKVIAAFVNRSMYEYDPVGFINFVQMTVNYMSGQKNDMFMQRYGFSSPVNPWDVIQFSGNARIHLDSFLSVFNISGLPEEYCHNSLLSKEGDAFVDGAVIAAARTLPTWSDGDLPPVPSIERKAVKELQEECQKMLAQFPTTSKKDLKILGKLLKLIMDASHQLDSSATFQLCKIS